MKKIFGIGILFLTLVSCDKFKTSSEPIEITSQWVRAVPSVSRMSAVYMTIQNNMDRENELISVLSSVAKNAEIHDMVEKDGKYVMQRMEGLKIPANGEVKLEQGGKHIMLTSLVSDLNEGDKISLTLRFRNGQSKQVAIPVMKSKPRS